MGVRQSERSIGAMAATSLTANAYANTSGHRQPGETCTREAVRPGSQGTKAVRGTWCSEGEAGFPGASEKISHMFHIFSYGTYWIMQHKL